MTDRKVTHIQKDEKGNITHLCYPGQAWSPVGRRQALLDIAAGYYRYYMLVDGEKRDITIGRGPSGYCLEVEDNEIAGGCLERLTD